MRYQVEITPQANEDLAEIVRYIAKDDPHRAEAFGMELVDQALTLSTPPIEARACEGTAPRARWFTASILSSTRSTKHDAT
jgi:plasmid stabilization system protein ParE